MHIGEFWYVSYVCRVLGVIVFNNLLIIVSVLACGRRGVYRCSNEREAQLARLSLHEMSRRETLLAILMCRTALATLRRP